MVEEEQVTFRNKADIRVQAQMSTGRTLVSTCLAEPGEIHILKSGSVRHDIYLKNAAIGWKVASRRDNETKTITLSTPLNKRIELLVSNQKAR